MSIPAIIMIIWLSIRLGAGVIKHGSKLEGNYNFGVNFTNTLIIVLLMYWGGFFE